MLTSTRKSEIVFERAVREAVEAMLSDLGFVVRMSTHTRRIIYAESAIWQMQFLLSYSSVNIAVRLMSEAEAQPEPSAYIPGQAITTEMLYRPGSLSKDPVYSFEVLEVIAPQVKERERYPRQLVLARQIRSEIERQLDLFLDHCMPMLQGDLNLWAEVREAERYGFGCARMEDESWSTYITRLRQTAEAAFKAGKYWSAKRLYSQMALSGGRLTFLDRIRFWFSEHRTFVLD